MTPDLSALQALWRQHDRVVLLQAGFGTGQAFLHTWQAWRSDAQRHARLTFIVIEPEPPDALALREARRAGPLSALANELAALWPAPTRNLHRLGFDGGRLQLMLAVGTVMDWLTELQAQVDVFLIEAVHLPAGRRDGVLHLFKALTRLAAPMARLMIALPLHEARAAMRSAGFEPDEADEVDKRDSRGNGALPVASAPRRYGRPGPALGLSSGDPALPLSSIASGDGRPGPALGCTAASAEAGVLRALYRPRFVPRRRVRASPPAGERHALIVGAGLAGCAMACALAEQGWQSTLIERHDAPADEGSGNPAGLFHGIVNVQDGAHARFNRAAALQAQHAVRQAIEAFGAQGSASGLLRLETSGKDAARMRAELQALRLPPGYVMALDADQASERCGLRLAHPAWYYPGGGWVQPAALARSFLLRAGAAARFVGKTQVQSLRHIDGEWCLHDGAGRRLASAATVVLANAADALRLLDAAHWPVEPVRGQLSLYANAVAAPELKMRLPSLPLAGAGWLLPEVAGWAMFGASAMPGNAEAEASDAEHQFNLLRLHQLSPQTLPTQAAIRGDMLSGQVGWRCVAADRLPLIGAVPDEAAMAGRRADRLHDVPRRPGLYMFSALASRGIAWSALGGQILAAQIAGAPVPLEASLVDALDPARFVLRAARRNGRRD